MDDDDECMEGEMEDSFFDMGVEEEDWDPGSSFSLSFFFFFFLRSGSLLSFVS